MADEETTFRKPNDEIIDSCKMDTVEEETMSEKEGGGVNSHAPDDKSTDLSKFSFKMPSLPVKKSNRDSSEKESEPKVKVEILSKVTKSDAEKSVVNSTDSAKHSIKVSNKVANLSVLSPAEQLKHSQIAIPYKEPAWSGLPEIKYSFEILKNGSIIDTVNLDKPYIVFGRLPSCDVAMEHPSLSRHHAIVQYCKHPNEELEKGVYLYDLDSTHGTWINKNKVYPNKYYRIRVGHVVKFGGSTRLHILQVNRIID